MLFRSSAHALPDRLCGLDEVGGREKEDTPADQMPWLWPLRTVGAQGLEAETESRVNRDEIGTIALVCFLLAAALVALLLLGTPLWIS